MALDITLTDDGRLDTLTAPAADARLAAVLLRSTALVLDRP
jgi:hypothetical protein